MSSYSSLVKSCSTAKPLSLETKYLSENRNYLNSLHPMFTSVQQRSSFRSFLILKSLREDLGKQFCLDLARSRQAWHIPTSDNLRIYVILFFLIPTTPNHNDQISEFLNSCKKEPIAFNTADNRKGLFSSFFLNVNQHRQAFLQYHQQISCLISVLLLSSKDVRIRSISFNIQTDFLSF